jgi:hypothetical protein
MVPLSHLHRLKFHLWVSREKNKWKNGGAEYDIIQILKPFSYFFLISFLKRNIHIYILANRIFFGGLVGLQLKCGESIYEKKWTVGAKPWLFSPIFSFW